MYVDVLGDAVAWHNVYTYTSDNQIVSRPIVVLVVISKCTDDVVISVLTRLCDKMLTVW